VSATRQPSLHQRIAEAVGANEAQIRAAVDLLDGGATVPFISRYRKEVTGGLSDSQLRLLEERLGYLREFDARRDTIAASIAEQGKLDDALRARLGAATTKAELEDLYLPYKKKRRTKGQIALEAGLGDLADGLWQDASQVPEEYAARFVDTSRGVDDTKAALDGAQAILMERFAEDASLVDMVASHVGFDDRARAADAWRARVVSWTWKVKLATRLETELFLGLRERADAEAIGVFAANMRDLLLAAPAGPRPTLGLDPGFRTGVKVTVVNATGKVVDHTAIFPHQPRNDWKGSLTSLRQLCSKHAVELIAIGNGTASRETERLADALIADMPEQALTKVVVSEAGASVYSASELAEREFPELDVTIRGAISIARRLQDPLAELVKIDPKAIGVGQYQHDVSQTALARSLDATVEDCVNQVGVDLGTASAALLSRVAGLDTAWLHTQNPADFTDERFGEPTVRDILAELEKPGRDPRPEFKTVRFADGVEKIGDLVDDQVLEGQVTNVTAFGAFVDVGVHQDGLVHISALSDTFVKDPRDVVKAGDIVKVKVMSVDVARKRIGLTMRMSDSAANAEGGRGGSARCRRW